MLRQVHDDRHKFASRRGAARTKVVGVENTHDRLETELARLYLGYGGRVVRSTPPFKHTDGTDLAYAARVQEDRHGEEEPAGHCD